MQRVFAIGETVYDIIFRDGLPVAAKPGGSMLNAMVSLGRLGLEPYFISEYGPENDPVGKIVNDFLHQNHVNTDLVHRDADSKTAVALAFLDDKNDAAYSFYRNPPEIRLHNPNIIFRPDDIFLFGSLFSLQNEMRPLFHNLLGKAKTAGAIIIYDPNFRKPHLNELPAVKPLILDNMQNSDIVRGSDEDFNLVFKASNLDEAFNALNNKANTSLIYTCNSRGVDLCNGKLKFHIDSQAIIPLSTIGAGDNFNAGVIWTLVQEGIGKKDLQDLPRSSWEKIISNGIHFSTDVCMSYDNYISLDFANEIRNRLNAEKGRI